MNTKILVCCHKQDVKANQSPYLPIHVGKALHPDINLGIQVDDEGDNISLKNGSYCELTGMYWAWKNLKSVDVIGLCHYRRYFDFHNQCDKLFPYTAFPSNKFDAINLDVPQSILEKIGKGAIILPKSKSYRCSIFHGYCADHISTDFKILREVMRETQPDDVYQTFYNVMYNSNTLIHYNMFLMRWDDFDNYCNWLFPILEKVEQRTDISNYDPVQRRLYGYLAERLFNVWTEMNRNRVITKPIIWIVDGDYSNKGGYLKYWLRTCINSFAMRLLKSKYLS